MVFFVIKCTNTNTWLGILCSTNSINTTLIHMGIHREINLFVRVNLAGHEFKGSMDVFKRRATIIYTYFNICMNIKCIINGTSFT
jgi:hypothetical protein